MPEAGSISRSPDPRDDRSAPAVDPARYLLAQGWNSQLWYEPEPPSVGSDPAVQLDQPVTRWRGEIEAQATREPPLAQVDAVVISQARATVIAGLLRELSTRLRPGLAVGPVQSDGTLARFVDELRDDLQTRSWR